MGKYFELTINPKGLIFNKFKYASDFFLRASAVNFF